MAVMPDMTDSADGFPFAPTLCFYFPPHNQTVALDESVDQLWHVSCLVPHEQNTCSIVFSVNSEYICERRIP